MQWGISSYAKAENGREGGTTGEYVYVCVCGGGGGRNGEGEREREKKSMYVLATDLHVTRRLRRHLNCMPLDLGTVFSHVISNSTAPPDLVDLCCNNSRGLLFLQDSAGARPFAIFIQSSKWREGVQSDSSGLSPLAWISLCLVTDCLSSEETVPRIWEGNLIISSRESKRKKSQH